MSRGEIIQRQLSEGQLSSRDFKGETVRGSSCLAENYSGTIARMEAKAWGLLPWGEFHGELLFRGELFGGNCLSGKSPSDNCPGGISWEEILRMQLSRGDCHWIGCVWQGSKFLFMLEKLTFINRKTKYPYNSVFFILSTERFSRSLPEHIAYLIADLIFFIVCLFIYNDGHNILRHFDIFSSVPFTTCGTKCDYY